MNHDLLDFLLDDELIVGESTAQPWRILIIDDDPDVHKATRFALSNFKFQNRPIQWLSAYSAKEAQLLLEHEEDIAMLFLDVVMENDSAGLDFARWYREQKINDCTRIILRTGQPGQIPEKQIIVDYDLHDYKTKTELTADRLFITTVSALRAYHDMKRLEQTSRGLEGVLHAATTLMQETDLKQYLQQILVLLHRVIGGYQQAVIGEKLRNEPWQAAAVNGVLAEEQLTSILSRLGSASGYAATPPPYLYPLVQTKTRAYALYVNPVAPLNDIELDMVHMFMQNVSTGLGSLLLYREMERANQVTVMSLAQITESRDHDTGEHVFRIADLCRELGERLLAQGIYPAEITPELLEHLPMSSTLHDVGKVAISDAILLKPGKLTAAEFEIMKTHTVAGARMLENIQSMTEGDTSYLSCGARIARSHHERWDGGGYPQGLAGESIPVEARIVSILDVFDALTHERVYKPAYTREQALCMIAEGRGSQFDPMICDVFLEMMTEQDTLHEAEQLARAVSS